MLARVATVEGVLEVDLETEEVEIGAGTVEPQHVETGLPRVVCAAAAGSTVIVVVDCEAAAARLLRRRPDVERGGTRPPPGFAIALAPGQSRHRRLRRAQPALSLAGRRRFWEPLTVELPDIEAVALEG